MMQLNTQAEEALLDAILIGNWIAVKRLIPACGDLNEIKYEDGLTPLFHAVLSNSGDICVELINAGADHRDVDDYGDDPLYFAARHRSNDAIEGLISAGANPDGAAGYYPLHIAAENDNIEAVKMLLKAGADVNAKDESFEFNEAMHSAARNGNAEMVEVLIKAGSDLDAKDWDEVTPIQIAQAKGHQGVVEILRKAIDERNEKSGLVKCAKCEDWVNDVYWLGDGRGPVECEPYCIPCLRESIDG